jgi:hypothetical protein
MVAPWSSESPSPSPPASWGFSDFLAGVQSRREQLLGLLIASQAVGVTIVVPLALASGQPLPAAGDVLWLMAAALAELGLVAPISGTAALVPLAVDLVAWQGLGVVGAIAGVALVSLSG